MAFAPIGERHAIAEIVFDVHVDPAINPEGRRKLKDAHDDWRVLLPKLAELPDSVPSVSAPPTPLAVPAITPLKFLRFKADGSVDWRLLIRDGNIVVNCLSYTRWAHIWRQARSLFSSVSQVLPDPTHIKSISLQYINLFHWDGVNEEYDVRSLISDESPYIPDCVVDLGPIWHVHQGWYIPTTNTTEKSILEHMNIDASRDDNGRYFVKFESLHQVEFNGDVGLPQLKQSFSEQPTEMDRSFDRLHDLAKESLGNYLTSGIQQGIDLHAS